MDELALEGGNAHGVKHTTYQRAKFQNEMISFGYFDTQSMFQVTNTVWGELNDDSGTSSQRIQQ